MSDLRSRAAQAIETATEPTTEPFRDQLAAAGIIRPAAAVPVETDPSIPADLDASIYVAWSRVMGEVQFIGKDSQRNDVGGRYAFRGIDDVLNVVGPALRKHGVMVVQTSVSPEYSVITTSSNKAMQRCVATVTYVAFGPRGDSITMQSVGEAFDAGDKSTPKACSVALRSLYINSLAIPTREPQMDPEHGPQHELAVPAPPTPAEYAREIIDPRTTLKRLQQILRELTSHPALGAATVQNETGGDEPLTNLLTRFGKAAAAKEASGS